MKILLVVAVHVLLQACCSTALEHRKLKKPSRADTKVVPGEYIVIYKKPEGLGVYAEVNNRKHRRHGNAKVQYRLKSILGGAAMVNVTDEDLWEILEDDDVEYVEPVSV